MTLTQAQFRACYLADKKFYRASDEEWEDFYLTYTCRFWQYRCNSMPYSIELDIECLADAFGQFGGGQI